MVASEDDLRPAGLQDPHPRAPGDGINAGRYAELSAATAGEMGGPGSVDSPRSPGEEGTEQDAEPAAPRTAN